MLSSSVAQFRSVFKLSSVKYNFHQDQEEKKMSGLSGQTQVVLWPTIKLCSWSVLLHLNVSKSSACKGPLSCQSEDTMTGYHIIPRMYPFVLFTNLFFFSTSSLRSYFYLTVGSSLWDCQAHIWATCSSSPPLILWGHNQYVPGRPFSLSLPVHLETQCEFKGHGRGKHPSERNTYSNKSIKGVPIDYWVPYSNV